MTRHATLLKVRETCFRIAAKKAHALASVSVMPDHVHLALRGNIEHSPLEIGLGFLNNLAFALGYNRCWSEEFYIGTFGEYDLASIPGVGSGR
jgi:REP element-mobilizing transposase RayT